MPSALFNAPRIPTTTTAPGRSSSRRWAMRLAAFAVAVIPVLGMAGPAAAWGSGNPPSCPSGLGAVSSYSFVINGSTTVAHLGGAVHSNDNVVVNFTIAQGCHNIQVSLASYRAPAPTYDRNTANQQVLFDSATGSFSAGRHSLQVFVPACNYQVDFVLGKVIIQLGPANTNNFYGDQHRLIDHDNGGTCSSGVAPRCELTAIIDGPPKQIQVTVQDAGEGLSAIAITSAVNVTVNVPTFAVGTGSSFVVTATKVDQTQSSNLGLRVTNAAGVFTDCDPLY